MADDLSNCKYFNAGWDFRDGQEDLRFLSPLLRHHIGIYGQYSFDFRPYEEIPSPEELSY